MTGGSPQARTASEDDDVGLSACPATDRGQRAAADRHAGDPASAGSATSMEEQPGSPATSRTPTRQADSRAPGWRLSRAVT